MQKAHQYLYSVRQPRGGGRKPIPQCEGGFAMSAFNLSLHRFMKERRVWDAFIDLSPSLPSLCPPSFHLTIPLPRNKKQDPNATIMCYMCFCLCIFVWIFRAKKLSMNLGSCQRGFTRYIDLVSVWVFEGHSLWWWKCWNSQERYFLQPRLVCCYDDI